VERPEARDDLQLVQEAQSGREEAFNLLVLRHRRAIFHTALGLLGDAQDADDLSQDVFIKAYESLGSFRGGSSFYTWLYRIAVNLSLNRIRARKVRTFFRLDQVEAILPAIDDTDASVERVEFLMKAREAILKLPDKQRAVFILRYFRDMSHAEIAEIMDRDVGTIKANYHQAVKKLRESLGNYVKGEDENDG
jgi:RNA polymerase sigma-70 factor (ECF subfamily)